MRDGQSHGSNWRSYGAHYRLGSNEHNINLTLDEKRALVLPTGNRTWPTDTEGTGQSEYSGHRGSSSHEIRTLGADAPSRGAPAPGQSHIGAWATYDWSRIGEKFQHEGKTLRRGAWDAGGYKLEGGGMSRDGRYSGTPVGRYIGPLKIRGVPTGHGYQNEDWPYGTGYYHRPSREYGSHTGPERNPNKNYLYIGDLLEQLPNKGFFTIVNNDNYSPSLIGLNGKITNGKELNQGFIDFIIQNIYAPITIKVEE